jgi:hypothetical protein
LGAKFRLTPIEEFAAGSIESFSAWLPLAACCPVTTAQGLGLAE